MNEMLIPVARWTQVDFITKAKKTGKAQLLTIPYSHYVELARWSWILADKQFEENWYMPAQHILPLLSLRRAGSTDHLSTTSFVAKAGRDPSSISNRKAKEARSTAVPALVQPDGTVLTDSWMIANKSGLEPLTDPTIKKIYDEELGPLARQFAYFFALKPQNRHLWDDLLCHQQGWIWCILYFFLGGFIHSLMSKLFGVGKVDLFSECEEKLDAVFDRIAKERLPKNNDRRYINGSQISVEDIALCSLAAPILLPPKYCGGNFARTFAGLESGDGACRKKVEHFRNTEVGKYVMRFYEENREIKDL